MKKYALTLIVLLAAIFILTTIIYAEAVVEIFDEWTLYQDEDSTTGQINVSIHQMTDYAIPLYISFYQGERTISIVPRDLDKAADTLEVDYCFDEGAMQTVTCNINEYKRSFYFPDGIEKSFIEQMTNHEELRVEFFRTPDAEKTILIYDLNKFNEALENYKDLLLSN